MAIDTDAEAEVLEENMFNEPAGRGETMFMVTLEMTYVGSETGNVFWDLTYTFIGSDGRGFTDTDADCGVVPNGLISAPELYPGGTLDVNVCWVVAESALDQPVMAIEELFNFSSEAVYFSLED